MGRHICTKRWGIVPLLAMLFLETAGAAQRLALEENTVVLRQTPWIVVYKRFEPDLRIYTEAGVLVTQVSVAGKARTNSISYVSTDRLGNFVVNIYNGENQQIAVYYARNGEEKWQLRIGDIGAIILSPDGTYAMNAMDHAKRFTLFYASVPDVKLANPLVDWGEQDLYAAHFTEDGHIVLLSNQGILCRYNPDTKIIDNKSVLQSAEGEPLRPVFPAWPGAYFSSEDLTLFAARLFRKSDTVAYRDAPHWALVHDGNAMIVLMPKTNYCIGQIAFAGKLCLATISIPDKKKWQTLLLKDNGFSVIDSASWDVIGSAVLTGNTIFYSQIGFKEVRKYDLTSKKLTKGLKEFPLFRERKSGKETVKNIPAYDQ